MILAIFWSPLIAHFSSIFQGIVAVISYIAPPITAVFVWGVFWQKASARASIITLISGTVLGFIVFILDWFKESTGWDVPSLMMSFYLFVVCSIILIVVSYLYPHKHTAESRKLVWKNPAQVFEAKGWSGIGNYKILSVLLFVTMVILYWIFG